jgi:hypothetical protein
MGFWHAPQPDIAFFCGEARFDIVIIVGRNLQRHEAVGFERFCRRENIVGPEDQVLYAQSKLLSKEVASRRAAVFCTFMALQVLMTACSSRS